MGKPKPPATGKLVAAVMAVRLPRRRLASLTDEELAEVDESLDRIERGESVASLRYMARLIFDVFGKKVSASAVKEYSLSRRQSHGKAK